MGAITRAAANNITTNGIILPAGINDASVASVSALAQVNAGDGITLISSQTASASSSISFTGIDSTYRTYMFKFINIHPSVDDTDFSFQGSINGGSSYGVTMTTTDFQSQHAEAGTGGGLTYQGIDLAQSTSYQALAHSIGTDNDQSGSGSLYLFQPSSTSYVKQFFSTANFYHAIDYTIGYYVGGYFNTLSAINAIDFKMSSGNIDAGTIQMYGIA